MEKKQLTGKEIDAAYNILKDAKLSKLDDADKVKVVRIARALKSANAPLKEAVADAVEKFKPEDYDSRMRRAQKYEVGAGDDADGLMTAAEYAALLADIEKYNKLVKDAVSDLETTLQELQYEVLTEDAFGKLIASNDWTVETIVKIEDFVM